MIDEEAILNYCRAARLNTFEVLDVLKELVDKKEIKKMVEQGKMEIARMQAGVIEECEPHV